MKLILLAVTLLQLVCIAQAQCAANATADASSGTCYCNKGFYGTSAASAGGLCKPCPKNTTTQDSSSSNTGTGIDVNACSICDSAYYISVQASAVPTPTAASCVACPQYSRNTQLTTKGISSCSCYDANAQPITITNNFCVCSFGFSGTIITVLTDPPTSSCTTCGDKQFSQNGSTCQTCPVGATLTNDRGGCYCNDIGVGTSPWTSTDNICQCKPNYYGDPTTAIVGYSLSCKTCPYGTYSYAGSAKSVSDCMKIDSLILRYSQVFVILLLSLLF